MAGSRLQFIGTVYSRMNGLLRTNAIKYEDRPIWYDVYTVFPPKLEPHYDREPVLGPGVTDEIPEIMYSEDIPRAAFFKRFGNNPGGFARNLMADKIEDASIRFIEKYNSIQTQNPDWTHDKIVDTVCQNFQVGFLPRNRGDDKFSSEVHSRVRNTTNFKEHYDDSDPVSVDSAVQRRGTKRTIVTADTLLSIFKEIKQKSEHKKDDSESSG